MDFFSDFYDQPTTPVLTKFQTDQRTNKNVKFSTQTNKKSNDEFDDLLDNLMSKQELKKSRKNIEPYSSQHIASDNFGKTVQRFPTSNNLQQQINAVKDYYPPPLSRDGNKASKKSILDDIGYDDNKSYRSGVTGRRGELPVQSTALINIKGSIGDDIPLIQGSMRGGMRPPLKKRAQSRENSIFDGDNKGRTEQDQMITDNFPKIKKITTFNDDKVKQGMNEPFKMFQNQQSTKKNQFLFPQSQPLIPQSSSMRQTSPEQRIQKPSNISPVVQQKLIQKHIPVPPAELTKRHQQEISLIKESYQRQLKLMKQNYEKIINQQSEARKNVISMMDDAVQKERIKSQKMMEEQVKRIKEVSQWQLKKRTQSYEMEVKRLKQLLDTVAKSQPINKEKQQQTLAQYQMNELSIKQKQLNNQRQAIEQQKFVIETQRRQFQSQQHEFELYRRREEQKLADERKALFEQQMVLKKMELETKKQIMTEKQLISTQLVETQLTIQQQKQTLNHEKEKLNLEKDLFNQQKMQYEKINQKIIDDLKDRKKQVEKEKQQVTELEVELYKKIHLMEMAAVEKGFNDLNGVIVNSKGIGNNSLNKTGLMKTQQNPMNRTANKRFSTNQGAYKQNNRNRINSQLNDKIAQTKNRYLQMEKLSRSNSVYEHSQRQSIKNGPKIHLNQYIEKLTRDKLKLMK